MTLSHTREKSDIISGDFMVRLRGHWLSNTRKLNGHYQSAKKTPILPVETWPYGETFNPAIVGMYGPDGEVYAFPRELASVKYLTNGNVIPNSDFEVLKGTQTTGQGKQGFFAIKDLKFDTYSPVNPNIERVSLQSAEIGTIYDGPPIPSTDLLVNFIIPTYNLYVYAEYVGDGDGEDVSFFDSFELPEAEWDYIGQLSTQRVRARILEYCDGLYPTGGFTFPPGFSSQNVITGRGIAGDEAVTPMIKPRESTMQPFFPLRFLDNGDYFSSEWTYPLYNYGGGINIGYFKDYVAGSDKTAFITWNGSLRSYYIFAYWTVITKMEAFNNHPYNALYQGG